MSTKKCTGLCGRELPLGSFHKDKTRRDGLRERCKECRCKETKQYQVTHKEAYLAYQKQYRENHKEELAAQKKQYQTEHREQIAAQKKQYRESHKEEERVRSKQYRESRKEELFAKKKLYYNNHKEEHRRRHIQYYLSNKDNIAEKARRHRQRHKQEIAERKKRYADSHKAGIAARDRRYRLANRQRIIEYDRLRYRRDREKRLALNAKRRARKKAVKGAYTPTQIQEQLKRQRYRCYYAACGHAKFKRMKGKYTYHIEHTFPLSRVAGTDIPANSISYLVLACPTCNLSKGNKYPWEWLDGGRLF